MPENPTKNYLWNIMQPQPGHRRTLIRRESGDNLSSEVSRFYLKARIRATTGRRGISPAGIP